MDKHGHLAVYHPRAHELTAQEEKKRTVGGGAAGVLVSISHSGVMETHDLLVQDIDRSPL